MREQPIQWVHAGETAAQLSGIALRPYALQEVPVALSDSLSRPWHDLRISITDRCNFRCTYCMPKEIFDSGFKYLSSSSMLSFDEIARVSQLAVNLGVRKLRLTGGEPLLRKHVEDLVRRLSQLRAPGGECVEIAMTTNGSLLARKAEALRAAGLNRITVSLDAMEDRVFRAMNDVDFAVGDVLDGVAAAMAAGLGPVKVNMVVKRGVNDDQVMPMIAHFRHTGVVLRFIEYMDVGSTNGWRVEQVLPSAELLAWISERYALHPLASSSDGETAQRYLLDDGSLEIGTISSITHPFCGNCNRARISTDGKLYLCLFAVKGFDLRTLLRETDDDQLVTRILAGVWSQRRDRYSELRPSLGEQRRQAKVEMSYIGG